MYGMMTAPFKHVRKPTPFKARLAASALFQEKGEQFEDELTKPVPMKHEDLFAGFESGDYTPKDDDSVPGGGVLESKEEHEPSLTSTVTPK